MVKKKSISLLAVFLVFALIAGIILPATSVNAKGRAGKKKVLVVYFSATGNTKNAAKNIKKATGGKLYQIKAEEPYTAEDLNYNNDNCRANKEQNNENSRPGIDGEIKNIRKYDVIFTGYPIWWGKEPMIIRTFLEAYNLEDKKIVPFCTSGGSGISGSIEGIKAAADGAIVTEGKDLTDLSAKSIKKWAKKNIK